MDDPRSIHSRDNWHSSERWGKKSEEETAPHPDRTYVGEAPFGSMYPKERLARMDQEGLEKAIIYPSLGLLWETEEVEGLDLQAAYAEAYNRWVVDFCSDSAAG